MRHGSHIFLALLALLLFGSVPAAKAHSCAIGGHSMGSSVRVSIVRTDPFSFALPLVQLTGDAVLLGAAAKGSLPPALAFDQWGILNQGVATVNGTIQGAIDEHRRGFSTSQQYTMAVGSTLSEIAPNLVPIGGLEAAGAKLFGGVSRWNAEHLPFLFEDVGKLVKGGLKQTGKGVADIGAQQAKRTVGSAAEGGGWAYPKNARLSPMAGEFDYGGVLPEELEGTG